MGVRVAPDFAPEAFHRRALAVSPSAKPILEAEASAALCRQLLAELAERLLQPMKREIPLL